MAPPTRRRFVVFALDAPSAELEAPAVDVSRFTSVVWTRGAVGLTVCDEAKGVVESFGESADDSEDSGDVSGLADALDP